MRTATAAAARLLHALVVTACLLGGVWGQSANLHTTSHALAGNTVPSHHHHGPAGHPSTTVEDKATQSRRRRLVAGARAARRVVRRVVPSWLHVRSTASATEDRGQSPPPAPLRLAALRAPELFCVFRT